MKELSEEQSKIIYLEKENQYLKELLDKAGISYKKNFKDSIIEKYDSNQGTRIIEKEGITTEDANQFFSMFLGRTDLYSQRTIKKSTGEVNYYPQCYNFWKNGCPKYYGKTIGCGRCDNQAFRELKKEQIILSSPVISGKKVDNLLELLKEKQLLGIHIIIVTWKPDLYGYGDGEYWMELQERMRKFGFEMNLVEDYCEHYCIVDKEIVWYGSMNFLGKEDVEDNLMRICNKSIAGELLEMTFGKGKCNGESM